MRFMTTVVQSDNEGYKVYDRQEVLWDKNEFLLKTGHVLRRAAQSLGEVSERK